MSVCLCLFIPTPPPQGKSQSPAPLTLHQNVDRLVSVIDNADVSIGLGRKTRKVQAAEKKQNKSERRGR